jgi:DNA-binding response OmpR family regulator
MMHQPTRDVVADGHIQIIRWPCESAVADRARRAGAFCLFVVEGQVDAPVLTHAREDWIRAPAPREDFAARVAALQALAGAEAQPILDVDGVLHFRGRSALVSPSETDLLRPLTERFGSIVPREELVARFGGQRTLVSRNALDLRVMRIRRRVASLGLAVRTAWGRGYLMEVAVTTD